jgi:hypothetical protein
MNVDFSIYIPQYILDIVEEKGGVINETLYINKRPHINFTCENGHTIIKRMDSFKKTWCAECTKNDISHAHVLAEKMSGKFLSDVYINSHSHYMWECAKGHQFSAKYSNVTSGKWCRQCLKLDYDEVKDLIESKGGVFITTRENLNSKKPMEIKCSEGHTFKSRYSSIKKGSWCPHCQEHVCERTCRKIFEFIYKKPFSKKRPEWLQGSTGRLELDGYCEELNLAFEYNGQQHYERVPYWHKTEAAFERGKTRDAEKKKLCRENNVELVVIPYTIPYDKLYEYIYENSPNVPDETPEFISYDDLDLCGMGQDKLRMVARKVADEWQGELLSTTYANNTSPLNFRCKDGHEFTQTWGSILAGIFCKKCTYGAIINQMRSTISEYERKAQVQLLEPYTRAKVNMKWKCLRCNEEFERTWDQQRRFECHCYKPKTMPKKRNVRPNEIIEAESKLLTAVG